MACSGTIEQWLAASWTKLSPGRQCATGCAHGDDLAFDRDLDPLATCARRGSSSGGASPRPSAGQKFHQELSHGALASVTTLTRTHRGLPCPEKVQNRL